MGPRGPVGSAGLDAFAKCKSRCNCIAGTVWIAPVLEQERSAYKVVWPQPWRGPGLSVEDLRARERGTGGRWMGGGIKTDYRLVGVSRPAATPPMTSAPGTTSLLATSCTYGETFRWQPSVREKTRSAQPEGQFDSNPALYFRLLFPGGCSQ